MRLLLMIVLLCVTLACCGEAVPSNFDVTQLMQQLAQVQSAQGRFVEKKYLRILKTPLESTGTLIYRAPGHLEKNTRVPKTESLLLDGSTLVIDSKVNGTHTLGLQDYPLMGIFIESIRSTLAGDLATLNKFYQVELDGDSQHWYLTLVPLDAKTLEVVREIHISGRGNWVGEFEILETKGDRSVMTVIEDKGNAP